MRALITGGAGPIGAVITRTLHAARYDVIVHHRRSAAQAQALVDELNRARPNSAEVAYADLAVADAVRELAARVAANGPLALPVNNASAYFPAPLGARGDEAWRVLLDVNAAAPLLLAEGLGDALSKARGSVVNITDAAPGVRDYEIYALSQAALTAATRLLARRLAPRVRVNAVAPGAISWPEDWSAEARAAFLARVPLERLGTPEAVAEAVLFLARADYITGQVLAVDGGLSVPFA